MRLRPRPGFSLVELVVALTIFSLGMLGLVAAAAMAHGSFGYADALERGTRAATFVLDSLLAEAAPQSGESLVSGMPVRWEVRHDSVLLHVDLELRVSWRDRTRTMTLAAARMAELP